MLSVHRAMSYLLVACPLVFLLPFFADAENSKAYVGNTNAGLLSVLDVISVGTTPARVAVSPDGKRADVTHSGSDSVSVVDTVSRDVVATVAVAKSPWSVAVTPDGADIYVATSEGVLKVIDAALIESGADPVIATLDFGAPNFLQAAGFVEITPD